MCRFARNALLLAATMLPFACGTGSETTSSSLATPSSSSISSTGTASRYTIDIDYPAQCLFHGEFESEHADYSGNGYWNGDNRSNAELVMQLTSKSNGQNTLLVRYANGGTENRQTRLTVGNERFNLSFATTGTWDTWQNEVVTFTSAPGPMTISLTSLTDFGLPNIDQLELPTNQWQGGECTQQPATVNRYLPAHGSGDAPVDTFLGINFDRPPSIDTGGTIRIFRTADNALVDEINPHSDQDFLAYQGQNLGRAINRKPLVVIGNQLRIYPHTGKLAANTRYAISITNGLFSGQINGRTVTYVDQQDWQFTTGNTPSLTSAITVDDDGNSHFRTIQGALNFLMQNQYNSAEVNIGPGSYYELLYLRGLQNITLKGAGVGQTRIFNTNAEYINSGSGASSASKSDLRGGRSLFLVENSDLLSVQQLTLHNTALRSANGNQGTQAEAIYFNSSGRLIAKNAEFISEQDTLLLKGFSWFYQATVVGNVDFIWGYAKIALFEDSEIRSIGDSKSASSNSGGYIVQARVQNAGDPGFVFLNSRFTNGKGPAGNSIGSGKTFVARSGNAANNQSVYDNISFINCRFDSHIAATGWYDESAGGKQPNPAYGNANAGLREYGSQNIDGKQINANRHSAFYSLSNNDYDRLFNDRTTIFARAGQSGSWLQ